uniref:Mitochondrial transcription termination factor 4 n=1 Tax=Sciurus vulgaris TaxID=55149 RepID=A0A8D2JCK0_SCIVU
MAALGRQVLDWQLLVRPTWACLARRTSHPPEQRRTTASLRKPTTASGGASLEAFSAGPRDRVQDPRRRTRPVQCRPEKRSTPVDSGSLELEKVISSLLDMGFTDAHLKDLLGILPGPNPQQWLDIVSELILLGLNPEPACVVLKKSPQLLKLPVTQMKKRSSYLRKLGLEEGKLRRVLHHCPEVFTMHQRDIDDIVRLLKEKCLFTTQQVTEILHRCPGVLREDPRELEYKFQVSTADVAGKAGRE